MVADIDGGFDRRNNIIIYIYEFPCVFGGVEDAEDVINISLEEEGRIFAAFFDFFFNVPEEDVGEDNGEWSAHGCASTLKPEITIEFDVVICQDPLRKVEDESRFCLLD